MTMMNPSKITEGQLPCPKCTSSDAYFKYNDGHGFCYSCRSYFQESKEIPKTEGSYHQYIHDVTNAHHIAQALPHMTKEYISRRGLTTETCRLYHIATYSTEDTPVFTEYEYNKAGKKYKWYDTIKEKKQFTLIGNTNELFGQNLFNVGCAKSITITEGEDDAPSVFQMLGSKWPSVSVRSSATAYTDCKKAYEYLNSFSQIYLCFDNDTQGQKAVKKLSKLFDNRKLYHVQMTKYKDANEYLEAGAIEEFKRIWYNAKQFRPEGIVSGLDSFREILESEGKKESIPYPFTELQKMTKGMRKGEIILLTAKRGLGKTEFTRSLEFQILKKTKDPIGIIHLEEGKVRALKGLAGLQKLQPMNMPDSEVQTNEIMEALEELLDRDDSRLHLYTHFGSDDPDVILDNIRYMVTSLGCQWIFLDHITMVVTGLPSVDQTPALDYISTQLGMMVEELNFGLVIVSHVNDDGLTRGSRNIENIAWVQIQLERDHLNPDPKVHDISKLTITKNRSASETGPAGELFFDRHTFTLRDMKPVDKENVPWSKSN